MRNLCIALRSLNRVTKKTFHLQLAEIAGAFPEESAAETLHPSDPEAYSGASSVEYRMTSSSSTFAVSSARRGDGRGCRALNSSVATSRSGAAGSRGR
jgi:hypothetical protein